jgi:putative thioredoxin
MMDCTGEKIMVSNNIVDATEANFDSLVIEYSHQYPVVVDFWAEWCGPCKMLSPVLERLTMEAGGAFRLAKVDVDSNQNLALRFGVHSIPAVKAIKDGQIVSEFVGVQPEPKIKEFISNIAPNPYDLQLEKAQSLINNQQWRQALDTLQSILDQDPENPPALLGLAKCYLMTDSAMDALSILHSFPASKEFRSAEMLMPLALALDDFANIQEDDSSALDASFTNALRLIKRGNLPAAMDGFMDILREDKHYRQDSPRLIILGLFEILGEASPLTRQYRQELSSILF